MRGRPKLTDEQKKSRNMTFRTRGGMREKLAAAAEANGRSMSEEIEARLLRSFERHGFDLPDVRYRAALFGPLMTKFVND